MQIELYTDGSATTKDKPGGYGYVICIDGVKHSEGNGHMPKATNNDAEMEAAIQGLAAVLRVMATKQINIKGHDMVGFSVTVCADSQLILGWIDGTYRFKQQDKIDRYYVLKSLVDRVGAKTRWVRGHSGDEHNERCDKLANLARLQQEEKIDTKVKKDNGDSLIATKKSGTICVWYKDKLKVIDLEKNVIEDFDREVHGSRGSFIELREEKNR